MKKTISFASRLALILCFASTGLWAQARTGAIDGTVRDATAQVLPGVSVTLEGQTLITSQVASTTAVGLYRFRNLPPGTFTLRFELSGFKTLVYEGAIVEVNKHIQINVAMELVDVQETITVVGESPMVDVKSTVIGATFDESLLSEIPSARDVWSLLEHQAPGVVTNRLDVGGSETGLQAVYATRGTSWTQNSYYLNGVQVTYGGASGYYYDYDSFEEVQVETGSHPASVNAPGVFMNMVTKTGGNTFRGSGRFAYQNDSTQSSNLDQELEDRGAGRGQAFDFLSDANFQIGGPIVPDKSSFYFSWRDERVHRLVSGFPEVESTDMWQYVIRNSTQLNDRNRIGGEFHHMSYFKPNRGAAGNRRPEATRVEDDTFQIFQAEWISTLSDIALFETRFSLLRVISPNFHQPDVLGQAAQDVGTGVFLNANELETTRRLGRRFSYKADLTYFAEEWIGANHEFKFGFEYHHKPRDAELRAIDDVFLFFNDGVADRVKLQNTPLITREAVDQTSFYVDDIINIGQRVTLKLGVRFDKYHGYLPEQNSPAGSFVPAREFPEIKNILDVASVAPRLALIVGLDEEGRTALKTSWGRYYHQFAPGVPNFANQNAQLSDLHTWTDLNGDDQFQNGEQGTLLSRGIASNRIFDPDYRHPYTDEFTLGVEKELMKDVAVTATFSYRKGQDLQDRVDIGVPFSAYVPVTVTDPGPDGALGTSDDGGQITVFNQDPATLGQNQQMLTNPEGNDSTYKGIEFTFRKRMSDNWQALMSYSYNDTDMITRGQQFGEGGGTGDGHHLNPNNLVNGRGRSFYDRTHQIKILGTWLAPYGFRISGVIRSQSGQPIARTFRVSGFNQGTITVLAEPVGTQRVPHVTTGDISIGRDFMFGQSRRLTPEVAIFNIANANIITSVNTRSGSAYNQVFNFLSPRIVRFGVKVNF